ncbi:MAG: hypothetical protein Q8M94_20975 [Ignavibacteria bacterium]|nr:hypothetical protein [Ignavibacteria bacterium]
MSKKSLSKRIARRKRLVKRYKSGYSYEEKNLIETLRIKHNIPKGECTPQEIVTIEYMTESWNALTDEEKRQSALDDEAFNKYLDTLPYNQKDTEDKKYDQWKIWRKNR